MNLSSAGKSCPNLRELDIAGAEVVTDFGVICLLFDDPEQIFEETWHRERTLLATNASGALPHHISSSGRRSLVRAFPHPHFDKPIPDPAEQPVQHAQSYMPSKTQYLYLKRSFHEVYERIFSSLIFVVLSDHGHHLQTDVKRFQVEKASSHSDPRQNSLGKHQSQVGWSLNSLGELPQPLLNGLSRVRSRRHEAGPSEILSLYFHLIYITLKCQ
jgi:hypothetical protein